MCTVPNFVVISQTVAKLLWFNCLVANDRPLIISLTFKPSPCLPPCMSGEFYFEPACSCSSVVDDGQWTPLTTVTTTTTDPLHRLSTVGSTSTHSMSAGCLPTEFICWSDASCVPLGKHCDGIPDCVDQSDEFACACKYCCWCSTQFIIVISSDAPIIGR